jgi:hypothetical protein
MENAKVAFRTRRSLIIAALIWTLILALAVPGLTAPRFGTPQQPIVFQVVTTIITVLALIGLARSVSGWRHLLTAPLWIVLILLQYNSWTWPN